MKLQKVRFSNFQSFGPDPTEIDFEKITYLIGHNGSGKTAALLGLSKMFGFDASQRRIQKTDFHIVSEEESVIEERTLWIEADFIFPELNEDRSSATVAPHFGHMRLDSTDGEPRVRYRLTATMGLDGDIEESLVYVLNLNPDGTPQTTSQVSRSDRNYIHVHYLPANRNPADHISFGTNALLGRILRSANWDVQRPQIKELATQITSTLENNAAVSALGEKLKDAWEMLHKGNFFADPKITFSGSDIEALIRYLSMSFSPGHLDNQVDFSRLSDGQKSMLYLSLVLASQAINRASLLGDKSFDLEKLRPPVFTIIAIEEPENSMSPHYLGRIVSFLNQVVSNDDVQVVIATHAPSIVRRVEPESIRYLRLSELRRTKVTKIKLPDPGEDGYKFVREALHAYPELYFSRVVLLGEGDSEEIVLSRLLKARGMDLDMSSIAIVPLGGRHTNHFWRLLSALEIPSVTLLDLDLARYQGGWGRISYVMKQLDEFYPDSLANDQERPQEIPPWNSGENLMESSFNWFDWLESKDVFFSMPLDLDFMMLRAFPEAYGFPESSSLAPDDSKIKAVLGDHCHGQDQYTHDELNYFSMYHKKFKLGSKPASHLEALSNLSDHQILTEMPEVLKRLLDRISSKLADIPE